MNEAKLEDDEYIVGAYGYLSCNSKLNSTDTVLMGLGFIVARLTY